MAVRATDLIELSVVKTELGISGSGDDAALERLIAVATDRISAYCDRLFHYSAAISEKVAGHGTPLLRVSRTPLLAVTSVTIDDTALASTEFEIAGDGAAGLIARKASTYEARLWPWTAISRPDITQDPLPGSELRSITVVYTGGWVTAPQKAADGALPARSLPYDVEQAALEAIVSWWRRRGEDKNITLEAVEGAQVSYGRGVAALPEFVKEMLEQYRRNL